MLSSRQKRKEAPMAMRDLLPEETTYIGIVLDKLSGSITTIWALDHEFRLLAFGIPNATTPLGTVVRCTVAPDDKDRIIAFEKVDDATYQRYHDNPYVKICRDYNRWRYWHEFKAFVGSCIWRLHYRFRRRR